MHDETKVGMFTECVLNLEHISGFSIFNFKDAYILLIIYYDVLFFIYLPIILVLY